MVLTKNAFCKNFAGFSRFALLSCAVISGAALIPNAPARAQVQEQQPGLINKFFGSDGSAAQPSKPDDAPAKEPGMYDRVMGAVGLGGAQQPARVEASRPSQPAAPRVVAAPVAVPAEEPGMFDKVMGNVGLGGNPEVNNIDYSERPKLVVPQQRDLPPPRAAGGPHMVTRPADNEALTKPPTEYFEKVRGADGQVSGLKDGDMSKDKKLFGLF